jgi:diguanylate cyclase (GGDEF)-like protein
MNAIAELEAANAATFEKVRSGEVDAQQLLVQLLTASCLLEITRLLSARVDIRVLVPAALQALTQFAPVDSCAIRIAAPDVPPTHAMVGEFSEDLDRTLFANALAGTSCADPSVQVGTLMAGNVPVGYLAATNVADAIAASGLIAKMAAQISSGLDQLIEAERNRRRLAAARALEIVAGIDDGYSITELEQFCESLAALPNALGARIALQNPRFGGPLQTTSGGLEGGMLHERNDSIEGRGTMTVEICWVNAPTDGELHPFSRSVDALVVALGRVETNLRLLDEVESDALTGVGNRRRALRVLSAARLWAEREEKYFSVLFVDLDHFKKVNDTLGHGVGDQVLTQFATGMAALIREYDSVARWGGEEFIVVCPNTEVAEAEVLAVRLLEALPKCCASVLPADWVQTASIGIAGYPVHGDNPTTVINAADEALYRSKSEGRNRASVASLATSKPTPTRR